MTAAPALARIPAHAQARHDALVLLEKCGMHDGSRPIDVDEVAQTARVHVRDDLPFTEVQQRGDVTVALVAPGTSDRTRRLLIAKACAVEIGSHGPFRLDLNRAFESQRLYGDDHPVWRDFSSYVNGFAHELLVPAFVVHAMRHSHKSDRQIATALQVDPEDIRLPRAPRRRNRRQSLATAV